jgi:hypothetical protein
MDAQCEAAAAPMVCEAEPRRSGVVIGTTLGVGLAGASGYPNNASLIGQPAYFSSSNLMVGPSESFFVMGALADYVNFGFFFGGGTAKSKDWRSTSSGIGFRLELFPLYGFSPKLRDLGVVAKFGVGGATLATRIAGDFPTSSGSQSFVGVGVFYDLKLTKLFGGHLSGGPTFDYDVITAPAIDRHTAVFGFRFAFYGGP